MPIISVAGALLNRQEMLQGYDADSNQKLQPLCWFVKRRSKIIDRFLYVSQNSIFTNKHHSLISRDLKDTELLGRA